MTLDEYLKANPVDPNFVFKPHAHVNTDGDLLQVYLTGESFYAESAGFGLDLHRRQSDDKVIGVTIWGWSKLIKDGE